MPIEARFSNDPQGAVTDAVRDDVGARLNQAYAAGELAIDDYQRLLDATFAAQHNADLVPIAQALPARWQISQPALGGDNPGAPGQLVPVSSGLPVRNTTQRAALVVAGVLVVALILLALILVL